MRATGQRVVLEYLSRQQVADLLGVDVKSWDKMRERSRKRDGGVRVPDPVVTFAGSPGWARDQIEAFAAATGRPIRNDAGSQ